MNILNSNNQKSEVFLKCKDHSVSGEQFDLIYLPKYDLLKTEPVPEKLDRYYESSAYISHTDRKQGLMEYIYQFVKKFTIRQKLSYIKDLHPQKGYLLDVGAGTGDFLVKAKKDGWFVKGVEPNTGARKLAEQKEIKLQTLLEDIKDQKFDVITMWHVLEHVSNIESYIQNLKNSLTNDGTIFVAVPNFKSHDAEYYKEYWAAYDVPRHLWHFSQFAMKQILKENKMRVHKIIPMKFDAYYVSLLSEKYKGSTFAALKGFGRGFLSNWKARSTSEYSSLIYVIKHA